MELEAVSALSITGMVFTLLISVVLPIVLLIVIRTKLKARISSFFIGCATFIVFALILEQILHLIVFSLAGNTLMNNILLYGLYGGLAAAAFEETGRFLTMKFVMKKNLNRENALMLGAGHGGIEAILIVGFVYINNLIMAFMINTGALSQTLDVLDPALRETTVQSLAALWETPGSVFFLAGIERFLTIILHICLSMLVYRAVSGKKQFFLIAFGIHFAVDFAAVVAASLLPLVWVEVIILLFVGATALFTVRIYKKEAVS